MFRLAFFSALLAVGAEGAIYLFEPSADVPYPGAGGDQEVGAVHLVAPVGFLPASPRSDRGDHEGRLSLFAPPSRVPGVLPDPVEEQVVVDRARGGAVNGDELSMERKVSLLTRQTSGLIHAQDEPVCWSYAASTVFRGNISQCASIPSEDIASPKKVGLIRGIREISGLGLAEGSWGINEYEWYKLQGRLASTFSEQAKADRLFQNRALQFLASPAAFKDCLVTNFGAYWSTKDFDAVWDRLPTCHEIVEEDKYRDANIHSEQHRVLLGAGKFSSLFNPAAIKADGGNICPFAHANEETFVVDVQWSYGSSPSGSIFQRGEPERNRAAFRNNKEFEESVAPFYDNHAAAKKWSGHSMALVGKIRETHQKRTRTRQGVSVVEDTRDYVVIKNSGGSSWHEYFDDCSVVHGFIICPRESVLTYTRIEMVQVLRNKSTAPETIDEHTSPRPSLCYAILAVNIDLVRKAFEYEKPQITFGSRLCDGLQAMDYASSLASKPERADQRDQLEEIADWLAEQEAARLVAHGHMGRTLCNMMTGADRKRKDTSYLPHLFHARRSHIVYQKGAPAMLTLIRHVATRCPVAINEFFHRKTQCTMLARMAVNGQNDAFVEFAKSGVGPKGCETRGYHGGLRFRDFGDGHATNAVARNNYVLLLRLLKEDNGKYDIDAITKDLLPEDDTGNTRPGRFGRSLLSHACLNETSPAEHGEKVIQKILARFGEDAETQKKAANGRDVDTEQTRLHDAVRAGNVAAVKVLLDKGATADVEDSVGRTPLFFVADPTKCSSKARCLDIAALLLEKMSLEYINMPAKGDKGQTALHKAVASANVELVGLLMAKGANKTAEDADGLTPLRYSETCGDESSLSKIVEILGQS